jgi:hypothetical protein
MYCLTRDKPIRLVDDEYDEHLAAVYDNEKELLPPTRPGEDEMQERLASLRAKVADSKIDW